MAITSIWQYALPTNRNLEKKASDLRPRELAGPVNETLEEAFYPRAEAMLLWS
jgi:hypothetical protein